MEHWEERIGPVVGSLYDAALDDAQWQDWALNVADAFGATSAVLKIHGGPAGPQLESVTPNLRSTSSTERDWNDHWHRNDLWIEQAERLGQEQVFTSQRLMPESQFVRTGFYQDWTRQLGVFHMVGVLFPAMRGATGVLGVHRPRGAAAFDEADRRRLSVLFPHVRRALHLRERLGEARLAEHAALQALDRIETGVLLVDASAQVRYTNRAAERLLQQGDHALGVRGRQLRIGDAGLHNRLLRGIREAIATAAGQACPPAAAMALQRPGRMPITLLVAPWQADWAPADMAQPGALVFVRDPEATASSASDILRALFGLTQAEATLALAVGEGRSLEQIAGDLGIGLGTVRTHLKRIFVKTGCSRQGALAALVARSVAGISVPRSAPGG